MNNSKLSRFFYSCGFVLLVPITCTQLASKLVDSFEVFWLLDFILYFLGICGFFCVLTSLVDDKAKSDQPKDTSASGMILDVFRYIFTTIGGICILILAILFVVEIVSAVFSLFGWIGTLFKYIGAILSGETISFNWNIDFDLNLFTILKILIGCVAVGFCVKEIIS